MSTPEDSSLGKEVAYPSAYDPGLLFPIPRSNGREHLGIGVGEVLPFIGHDRWHAYELGWLDPRGKPCVATATLVVPCHSPRLVESKSLKLYLNSFNHERFEHGQAVRDRIAADLTTSAGAEVAVELGLPPMVGGDPGQCIDAVEVTIDHYGPPRPDLLQADPQHVVEESLVSHLLKSNCPVTGQPDWATLRLDYRGPQLARPALLRYIASFRNHAGFHEQCVETIFQDLSSRCSPLRLSVEARYTRRGGLDINPWRASIGSVISPPHRELRQ